MINKEYVSVLVFTYNQENFIKECLENVLSLDYPYLKCFVCDDASTDNTQNIILEYVEKYPELFIPVFQNINGGITANFNAGLDKIDTRFALFTAGDDLIAEDRINKQLEMFAKYPEASVCMGDVEIFYDDNFIAPHTYRHKLFANSPSTGALIRCYNHQPSSTMMIDMEKAGHLRADPRIKIVNDWLYLIEVVACGGLIYVPQVVAKYRRHKNNTTQPGINHAYLADRLISADIFLEKYKSHYFSIKFYRSNQFCALALRHLKAKDFKQARKFALWGLCECTYNPKSWILFSLCCLGRFAHGCIAIRQSFLLFKKKFRN